MATVSSSRFGQMLRRFRLVAGLSQEELAERAGLSTRGISDLERGLRASPRPETVRLLADALTLGADERASLITASHPELTASSIDPVASVSTLPPPATTQRRPPVVVAAPIRLVGREAEIKTLRAILRNDVRLVTLTGPGGVGKTQLALAVVAELATDERFADGIALVELAPIRDPALVASAVAATLGIKESGGRPLADSLREALRTRRLLLLLDNFEHLLPAALLVAELLAACPHLVVMATSRERLHLRGEREVHVEPLALPSRSDPIHPGSVDALATVASISLFVERAVEARPGFALTVDNAPIVVGICRRLDGLPLAIELAAAWLRVLPPPALLERLERRLPLLAGGAHDLPARQQTLRATIGWSYDLLTAAEQTLFRHLSVFVGGIALDAVEEGLRTNEGLGTEGLARSRAVSGPAFPQVAIGDATEPHLSPNSLILSPLDALASLVEKNLLQQSDGAAGEARYLMLETVREFGLEQLAASGDEPDIRQRHAAWCLAVAEQADPVLLRFSDHGGWLWRLHTEQDNMRAALTWCQESGDSEMGLRLAGGLSMYWYLRGGLAEGRRWLDRALALGAEAPAPLRARALLGSGFLALYQGAHDDARAPLTAALALYRSQEDAFHASYCLFLLGVAAEDSGAYDRAAALLEEARELTLHGATASDALVAVTCYHQGVVASGQGDLERAMMRLSEARQLAHAAGATFVLRWVLGRLAIVASERGDHTHAAALLHEALTLGQRIGEEVGTITELAGLGVVAVSLDRAAQSARLFGAVQSLRATMGLAPTARMPERSTYDRAIERGRAALGPAAFAAAWDAGTRLTLEQVVAEALAMTEAIAEDPAERVE